jgi:choline kinase
MKVVILAAGKGSRLHPHEPYPLPKSLAQLTSTQSILSYQIESLLSYFSKHQICAVVGYRKEKIMEAFPELIYINNVQYQTSNTARSLLLALNTIDDDVLWLNGDVVFHPSILHDFVLNNQTSMLVNQAPVSEEEIKYRTDGKGNILEISKQVLFPEGEAIGIHLFKKADLPWLKNSLKECMMTDFFERGIELGIQKGHVVKATVIATDKCLEVDFAEDLIRAQQLVHRWCK